MTNKTFSNTFVYVKTNWKVRTVYTVYICLLVIFAMLEENARSSPQETSANIGRPEASVANSRNANVSTEKTKNHVPKKSNPNDPGRSCAWFLEHGPPVHGPRPLTSPILGGVPSSSILIGQQAASLQLAHLKAHLALTQLNSAVTVGCHATKLTPPSPTAAAISLLNLLKIANTMSHPLLNPFVPQDLPGTSVRVGHESNSSFSASYSASAVSSGGMIPSQTTQSQNYSRAISDADVSGAREDLTFHPGQNTHFPSTHRVVVSSVKEDTTYPMSSTSASLSQTLSDVEGQRSLNWLPKYRRSTTENPFHSLPGSSNSNRSDFNLTSYSDRKCDVQSVTGLGDFNKTANPTETRHPKYTAEAATKMLSMFGLEKDDLELLLSYPEDQLTPDNLPFILRQIRIQKTKRSTTTAESNSYPEPQPIRSARGMDSGSPSSSVVVQPHKMIDYEHTSRYFGGGVDEIGRTISRSAKRDGSGSMFLDSYKQFSSSASRDPLKNNVSPVKISACDSSYGHCSSYGSMPKSVAPVCNDQTKQLKVESNQTLESNVSSLTVSKKDKDGTAVLPQVSESKQPGADHQLASKTRSSYTLVHGMHPDRPGLVLISINDPMNKNNPGEIQSIRSNVSEQQTKENPMEQERKKKPAVQTGKALRIPVIAERKCSVVGSPQHVHCPPKFPTSYLAKPPVFKDLPTPAMTRHDTRTTPKVFPHSCSLCHQECSNMKDWITHQNQNTRLHLENCRVVQSLASWKHVNPSSSAQDSQKYFEKSRQGSRSHSWSSRPHISKNSKNRRSPLSSRYNHSYRSHSPRYDRHRSHLKDHERPRTGNERRSSPCMSEDRLVSRKRIHERRLSPRRRDERRSSRSCETKRRRSSSIEKLVKEILDESESNAQAVVSGLLTELTKVKSSSSPSPSAGGKTSHSASSSSAAKKRETTTTSKKDGQQDRKNTEEKTTPQKTSLVTCVSKLQINKSTATTTRKTTDVQTPQKTSLNCPTESVPSSSEAKTTAIQFTKDKTAAKGCNNITNTNVAKVISETTSSSQKPQKPEKKLSSVVDTTNGKVEENSNKKPTNMSSKYAASENPPDVETTTSEKSDTGVQRSVVVAEETDKVDELINTTVAEPSQVLEVLPLQEPKIHSLVVPKHFIINTDETANKTNLRPIPEILTKAQARAETISSSEKSETSVEIVVSVRNKEIMEEKLEKPTNWASKSTTTDNRPDVETSKLEELDTEVVVIKENTDHVAKLLLFETQTTTDKPIRDLTEEMDKTAKSVEETGKLDESVNEAAAKPTNVPVTEAKVKVETNSFSREPETPVGKLISQDGIKIQAVEEKCAKPKIWLLKSTVNETNVQQFVVMREDTDMVHESEVLTEPGLQIHKQVPENLPDAESMDTGVQQSAEVSELDCGAESGKVDAETKGAEDTKTLEVGEIRAEVAEVETYAEGDEKPDKSSECRTPACLDPPEPEDTHVQSPQTGIKTPEASVKASAQDPEPESTAPGQETKMEASQPSSSAEGYGSKLSFSQRLRNFDLNCVTADAKFTTESPHSEISETRPGVKMSFPAAAEPNTPNKISRREHVNTESEATSAGDAAETEDNQKLGADSVPAASNSTLSSTAELLHIDKDTFMAIKAAISQYRLTKVSRSQTEEEQKSDTCTTGVKDEDPESGRDGFSKVLPSSDPVLCYNMEDFTVTVDEVDEVNPDPHRSSRGDKETQRSDVSSSAKQTSKRSLNYLKNLVLLSSTSTEDSLKRSSSSNLNSVSSKQLKDSSESTKSPTKPSPSSPLLSPGTKIPEPETSQIKTVQVLDSIDDGNICCEECSEKELDKSSQEVDCGSHVQATTGQDDVSTEEQLTEEDVNKYHEKRVVKEMRREEKATCHSVDHTEDQPTTLEPVRKYDQSSKRIGLRCRATKKEEDELPKNRIFSLKYETRRAMDTTAGVSDKRQESGEVTKKTDKEPVASTSERTVRRRSVRGKKEDLTEASKKLDDEKTSYKITVPAEDKTKEPRVTTRLSRGGREGTVGKDDTTEKENTLTRRRRSPAREAPKKEKESTVNVVKEECPTRGGKGRRVQPKKSINMPKEESQKKSDKKEDEEGEVSYQILDSVKGEMVDDHPSTEESTCPKEMETSKNTEKRKNKSPYPGETNDKVQESNGGITAEPLQEVMTLDELLEEEEVTVLEQSTQEVHATGKEDGSAMSSNRESQTDEAEDTSRDDGHKDNHGTIAAKRTMEFDGPEVKRSRQVPCVFKMPPFNSTGVFGPEFVVPKTGFFCNVCRLFFLKEVTAKSHCSSQQHYDKLQKHYEELQRNQPPRHQTPKSQANSGFSHSSLKT